MKDYSILDADLPTMVVRCNNKLILRSVITGQLLEVLGPVPNREESIPVAVRQKSQKIEEEYSKALEALISLIPFENQSKTSNTNSNTKPETVKVERNKSPTQVMELPPCKVQRNYCCTLCSYYTQNPRSHLLHQRDVHGIRLSIHGCQHCQYASRYCQKLKRHVKMVHTIGNVEETTVKNEKSAADEGAKETKLSTSKPKECKQPTSPVRKQSSTASIVELPSCSKAINTLDATKIPEDIKNDPEAFFVSAYKNQLQKQLEYDQQLKNLTKTFNTESNKLQQPCEIPKQPKEVPILHMKNQSNSSNNTSVHITQVNTEFKGEPNKKRMYSCRKCNYITHIKSRYNKHVKYHSMPMIQCDKCEFRTTYKWNLTRHLRNHHSNGIYKCSVCSFSANMKQSLTSHEVNHHSPPVGRAVSNKPIRKRRCRVGGSDLLSECNGENVHNDSPNSSNELSSLSNSEHQTDEYQKVKADDIINSNVSTSNEMELNKSEGLIPDPACTDFSDFDNSDLETTASSDMETDSYEDRSSSSSEKLDKASIHVDADFFSSASTAGIDSQQRKDEFSFDNIVGNRSYLDTTSEEKVLEQPSEDLRYNALGTTNEQKVFQQAPEDFYDRASGTTKEEKVFQQASTDVSYNTLVTTSEQKVSQQASEDVSYNVSGITNEQKVSQQSSEEVSYNALGTTSTSEQKVFQQASEGDSYNDLVTTSEQKMLQQTSEGALGTTTEQKIDSESNYSDSSSESNTSITTISADETSGSSSESNTSSESDTSSESSSDSENDSIQ